jgi:hypothetical protein
MPAALAQRPALAPNVVDISPRLVTSGQPSAESLANLKALGFEAVIYLAPPTVQDAVRDEPLIVTRQGLTFINIPIRFDHPTEADFDDVCGRAHRPGKSQSAGALPDQSARLVHGVFCIARSCSRRIRASPMRRSPRYGSRKRPGAG